MTKLSFNGHKVKGMPELKERVKEFVSDAPKSAFISDIMDMPKFLTGLEEKKIPYKIHKHNGISNVLFEAKRKQQDGSLGLKLRWCKRFK